jgi:hypothetical protein
MGVELNEFDIATGSLNQGEKWNGLSADRACPATALYNDHIIF